MMNKVYGQSFGKEGICELIPHRSPFLLIDNVESWGQEFLVGNKKVLEDDPIFQGHFPSHPIYPGVYLVEGLAQAAAALLCLVREQTWKDGIYYLASLSDVKFRSSVYPGDTITYRIDFKKRHTRFFKVTAVASVGDKEACSAIITSAQGKEM